MLILVAGSGFSSFFSSFLSCAMAGMVRDTAARTTAAHSMARNFTVRHTSSVYDDGVNFVILSEAKNPLSDHDVLRRSAGISCRLSASLGEVGADFEAFGSAVSRGVHLFGQDDRVRDLL